MVGGKMVKKRGREDEGEPGEQPRTDHTLLPFRIIGAVTGAVSPAVVTSGRDSFVLCAVGRSLHEYNLGRLDLIHVSQPLPHKIRAVAKSGTLNIAAARGTIYCFKTRRLAWSVEHAKHAKVIQLYAKDNVLLSLGTDSAFKVYDLSTGEELNRFELSHKSTPTCFCTVRNYNTRILVGCGKHLELWNFNTGSLVHRFDPFDSPVTTLTSAPADDTVGVGLADGTTLALNLVYGNRLFTFKHRKEAGSGVSAVVTAISFRNDGPPMMCSATEAGEVAVWNLESKTLEGLLTATVQANGPDDVFETPHTGRVTRLHFLPEEPVLLTAGEDNALRMYHFDKLSGTGKLLRERRGHHDVCTKAHFFDSRILLSASMDRTIRANHVFTDALNKELSQGAKLKEARKLQVASYELRLPPMTCIDSCTLRTHDWAAVLTAHRGRDEAQLWRIDKFAMDIKKSLKPPTRVKNDEVVAVCISRCGAFGVMGMASGRVYGYNLQSCAFRCTYVDEAVAGKKAHDGRVVGTFVSHSNGELFTIGTDMLGRVWSFPPPTNEEILPTLLARLNLASVLPTSIAFDSNTSFVAVASVDHVIRVYDMDPKSIDRRDLAKTSQPSAPQATPTSRATTKVAPALVVRTFSGHINTITGMAFSPDSRHLSSVALDSTLHMWEMPTARKLDVIRFPSPATSVSFHREGYFIATTHANCDSVYLWTNKMKYGHIPVPFKEGTAIADLPLFKLPDVALDGYLLDDEDVDRDAIQLYNPEDPGISTTPQLLKIEEELNRKAEPAEDGGLISLSGLPKAKWANLPLLDLIKKRNAPIAPPKKIDAPFFLPTSNEPKPKLVTDASVTEKMGSRISNPFKGGTEALAFDDSDFVKLLYKEDYATALELLEAMGTSKVDLELKSLAEMIPEGDVDEEEVKSVKEANLRRIEAAMRFFEHHLARRAHFEFLQAALSVFLRYHGPAISSESSLAKRLPRLQELQKDNADLLGGLLDHCICLTRHFTMAV